MKRDFERIEIKVGDEIRYQYLYDYEYIRMKNIHERKYKLEKLNNKLKKLNNEQNNYNKFRIRILY